MGNDADRFAAQDTVHDMCEENCGVERLGVDCPTPVDRSVFMEMLKLIAQYDWAREGGSKPPEQEINREQGKKIRDGLVKLTQELSE